MPIVALVGHERAKDRLREAVKNDKLPQAILIEGPEGVGRQQVAMWLAQLLFCTERAKGSVPCGKCRGCRLVADLSHPDVHWFVPVPRPKAGDLDKQVDEVAQAMGEVMAERRKAPLYEPPDGMAIHGVASARLIQRRAAMKSVEGGPRVFIVGDAERLVPQDSSHEAANTLLKLLEEPPAGSHFILTAREGAGLLPTIRSRVVSLRLAPLPDPDVRAFLKEHLGLSGQALETKVRQAGGAIGRAVGEGNDKAATAARDVLKALNGGDVAMAERLLKQSTWAARGEFTDLLEALETELSLKAREAAGQAPGKLDRMVAALEKVAEARERARGNVNPQLLLAVLMMELAGPAEARREPVTR